MMARVMINNPKIVLLDEPLSPRPFSSSRYTEIYFKDSIYRNGYTCNRS